MDMDEEDFVFFGTPIEREEELASRKKKAVAEASGHLRTLVPWKQEVRDEEGRRRFHGAFTGGFSAGYYNTAGSKEGWTPQSFTSSRKNRAEVKQQSILNFLDDDEKAELEGQSLGTSSQFDTFGFTAAEFARKQVEKEQQQRPSAIPGPVPSELVLPVTESIGVKLLLKMGWRRGHSLKDSSANSLYDARREARKALLAFSSDEAKSQRTEPGTGEEDGFESSDQPAKDDIQTSNATPVFVRNPKQDLHGLGYDPYKHAPEFREKKRSRLSDSTQRGHRKPSSIRDGLFGLKSGKAAPGFGIGALEEYDVEDEDVYTTAYDFEETHVQEVEEPPTSSTDHKPRLVWKEHGVLPGFKVASNSDYQLERFDPPVIPKDFVPHHKFPGPIKVDDKHAIPPPPEVPPPYDGNLKLLIDGVATLVARCGKLFEDLSREKNQSNPLFNFLDGGNGHEYYAWKLWEEQQKRNGHKTVALDGNSFTSEQKMTAETRGKILGERPLEKSLKDTSPPVVSADLSAQFNLSDTFTNSVSSGGLPELAKPFKDDPAKQARFEMFLKEKYRGGLRTTDSIGASNMSEAARARERLDFEAAAEAIDEGKWNKDSKLSVQQFMDFSSSGAMQFTSGGLEGGSHAEDLDKKSAYPTREEFQWRPHPVLCKRFDLIDPFMGKPPPPPRMKSKMDSFVFTSDSVKATKLEGDIPPNRDRVSVPLTNAEEMTKQAANSEKEVEVETENVERPVDLYKAIFSDDSDDEVEIKTSDKTEDPEKRVEVAHSTLNRLIAGDFLESLGKELGLAVPPDLLNKTDTAKKSDTNKSATSDSLTIRNGEASHQENPKESEIRKDKSGIGIRKHESVIGIFQESSSRYMESGKTKKTREDSKLRYSGKEESSGSSEDERSRKRRGRHRYSSSESDSYSDSDRNYRSKGRRKESSREKRSSSRKHHKRRSRDERSKSKREKRKSRD